jgi:carboxymethylenebutenolidase
MKKNDPPFFMKFSIILLFGIIAFGTLTVIDANAIAYFPPPLKQTSDGVEPENVTCTEGLELVIKRSNGSPACIKPSSVAKLIERNWAVHILPNVDSNLIQNSELTENGKYNVETSFVSYDDYTGFLVRPTSTESFPGVVMIHEWWGLNENMKETASKLASYGYVVLAVDLFNGDVANDAQKATQMVSSFDQEQGTANMNSAVDYLQSNYDINKIGSIGWCFGGGQSLNVALNNEDMDATVIYYGRLITEQDTLSKIQWPVLGIFAELDQGIPVTQVKEFENSLNELEIPNEIHIYPGVDHAFANPTGERYAPAETDDAWEKTLKFLKEHLS